MCFDYPQTRRGVNGPPPSVSVNCPRNSKPRAPYHSLFDWCSPRPQTSHPRHLTEAPGNGPRTSGPNFKKLSPGGVQHLSRKATGPASNPLKEIMDADWGVIIDARTAPERILKVRGHDVYRLPRFSAPANGTPFVFLQISAWGQLYNHTNPWVYALCVFSAPDTSWPAGRQRTAACNSRATHHDFLYVPRTVHTFARGPSMFYRDAAPGRYAIVTVWMVPQA